MTATGSTRRAYRDLLAIGYLIYGVGAVSPFLRERLSLSDARQGYWLRWLLVVAVVAVEFTIVFWAATLAERRVGTSLPDAALAASGFYVGMIAGRFGLSLRTAGELDPLLLIRLGLFGALVGAMFMPAMGARAATPAHQGRPSSATGRPASMGREGGLHAVDL